MTEDGLIDSDSDINENEHSKLLEAVTQLEGKHRVKPSTRKEPTTEISEFHLVKSGDTDQDAVRIHELTQVLEKHTSHNAIAQKIRATKRHIKTLPKPLEKPEANRIDRTVRYENVKEQLRRWDAVVHANRLADKLSFPLNQSQMRLQSSTEFLQKFKPETPLEIEIAKILAEGKPKSDDKDKEDESEYPLTLEEMMERREELMQLRSKQWNRESKAAHQKKIKSKKYHRILRREKIKEQLKEFEAMKKTDPEAALERLEQLDKTRAEERASLRHRSTGHWARNRAVRAKYDKESRQVLAQQLSISRELTQKVRKGDSSDDDDDDTTQVTVQSLGNPWVDNGVAASAEITDFVSGYRKYWQNKVTEKSRKGDKDLNDAVNVRTDSEGDEAVFQQCKEIEDDTNANESSNPSAENLGKIKCVNGFQVEASCEVGQSDKESRRATVNVKAGSKTKRGKSEKPGPGNKKMKKATKSKAVGTASGWIVESKEEPSENTDVQKRTIGEKCTTGTKKRAKKEQQKSQKQTKKKRLASLSVDELFDDIDAKLQNKINEKIKNLKQKINVHNSDNVPGKSNENNSESSLAFKRTASRPVLDEELREGIEVIPSATKDSATPTLTRSLGVANSGKCSKPNEKRTAPDIDPNQFLTIKPQHLKSLLPDLSTAGDEALDDDEEKHITITEAFAEDNVVGDFRKEKEELVSSTTKEKEVDLSMPGWGQWGGKNLPSRPRKKRRMIIRKPPEYPRKDSNKGNVIINEQKDDKIKAHLVNELPFPFTSVKSFEASIRAPIGNTWVPATSFWQLTNPEVETKLGAVIEPMDESHLIDFRNKSKKVNTNGSLGKYMKL